MMLFVAALLPVVIYIIVVYQIDNFSLISVKRLLLLILSGMLTALACFALFQLTGTIIPQSLSDSVNPIIEEMVKGIPLLWLAARKKIVFFMPARKSCSSSTASSAEQPSVADFPFSKTSSTCCWATKWASAPYFSEVSRWRLSTWAAVPLSQPDSC